MGSGPCNHISWKQQEASQDAVTIWLLKQDPSNANASKHANLMWRGGRLVGPHLRQRTAGDLLLRGTGSLPHSQVPWLTIQYHVVSPEIRHIQATVNR